MDVDVEAQQAWLWFNDFGVTNGLDFDVTKRFRYGVRVVL